MRIFLLDNYDSFTYNLVHLFEQFDGVEIDVFRNDEVLPEAAATYDRIVLSPGPGIPSEAGILLPLIKTYSTSKKIFGVCLGLQAIVEAFGGSLYNLPHVLHGVARPVHRQQPVDSLFAGLPSVFSSGRYHSWAVDESSLPSCFHVTARDEKGVIVALTHENELVRGVQFHPESILTDYGKSLIDNWLSRC